MITTTRLAVMVLMVLMLLRMASPLVQQLSSDFFYDIDGISIGKGYAHTCVLEAKLGSPAGKARCWGGSSYGEIEPPEDESFVQITAGFGFTCGINIDQELLCWGRLLDKSYPGKFTQISAGYHFLCGVMADGNLNCWGASYVPQRVPQNNGITYVQISCAVDHCCALDDSGFVHCFGVNGDKILTPPIRKIPKNDIQKLEDDEDYDDGDEPVLDDMLDTGVNDIIEEKVQFRQISVGQYYSCGILYENNDIECWGGIYKNSGVPHYMKGPFKQVSVGLEGVCGIYGQEADSEKQSENSEKMMSGRFVVNTTRSSDQMQCWGTISTHSLHNDLKDYEWDQVGVGHDGACAVTMDSQVYCWGGNADTAITPTDEIVVH